jgi:hypothetical protein
VRGPYRVTDDAEIDFHAPSILKAATGAEKTDTWLRFGAEKAAVPETSPASVCKPMLFRSRSAAAKTFQSLVL